MTLPDDADPPLFTARKFAGRTCLEEAGRWTGRVTDRWGIDPAAVAAVGALVAAAVTCRPRGEWWLTLHGAPPQLLAQAHLGPHSRASRLAGWDGPETPGVLVRVHGFGSRQGPGANPGLILWVVVGGEPDAPAGPCLPGAAGVPPSRTADARAPS